MIPLDKTLEKVIDQVKREDHLAFESRHDEENPFIGIPIHSMFRDAVRSYIEKAVKNYTHQYLSQNLDWVKRVIKEEALSQSFLKYLKLQDKKSVLITVNPKPDVYYPQFIKLCHKASKKKWLLHKAYAIEVRQKKPPFGGIHLHIISYVPRSKTKYHMISEFANTFKNHINNKASIHINSRAYLDGYRYLIKPDKIKENYSFRSKYKLEKVYGTNSDL